MMAKTATATSSAAISHASQGTSAWCGCQRLRVSHWNGMPTKERFCGEGPQTWKLSAEAVVTRLRTFAIPTNKLVAIETKTPTTRADVRARDLRMCKTEMSSRAGKTLKAAARPKAVPA